MTGKPRIDIPMRTTTGTIIAMIEDVRGQSDLLRLMTWLSPAFPVGAFAYSHGLERAVHDGRVEAADDLADWLWDLVARGSGWNDIVLAAAAHRACDKPDELLKLSELGEAIAGSGERHLETMAQGTAFRSAAAAWGTEATEGLPAECPYPVAVGAVSGRLLVGLGPALTAFTHAFVSNLVQAAVRLGVIGQTDAVALMRRLEPTITEAAERGARSSLDDLGSSTFMSEIMSLKHETQYSRLFRS